MTIVSMRQNHVHTLLTIKTLVLKQVRSSVLKSVLKNVLGIEGTSCRNLFLADRRSILLVHGFENQSRKVCSLMKTRTLCKTAAVTIGASMISLSANSAEILVTADIATSTTWTKNNTYNLQGQRYILPGATLTIQAGTVVASDVGGSLAVTRDGRIDCVGTKLEPVIFTSKQDVATWTAGNPKTGTWRAVANEWGNVTVMGNAMIGKYGQGAVPTNTASPNGGNYANMEGLTASGSTDTRTFYGGGNDLDNSGRFEYVSLRYGGKVVGLGNELNGLSLGGIGRETKIDHIEIMNNVDDGIEIWGGCVDLKYVTIWNIGDDSLDVDHGWRGKIQFGLIVAGYSIPGAASGSGFCDSLVEMDGAAKSDAQPVTTACFYNLTLIGQPLSGRNGTKWRDNARAQFNNCIFMDIGSAVVRNDNTDGEATDGQTGYGYNGTLTFANTWTTNYNVYSTVNPYTNPAAAYQAQQSGKLIQYTDSVFYNNTNAAAYTEANARGVFAAANNNVLATAGSSPIAGITRGPNVISGTIVVQPVISLDPRAANDALTSVSSATSDTFFTNAQYRGAFGPNENWLCGWTAADAFGMSVAPPAGCASSCVADINVDGVVDAVDLSTVLSGWGSSGSSDINRDGNTNAADLTALLSGWGNCI